MANSQILREWNNPNSDFYYPANTVDKPKHSGSVDAAHGRDWKAPQELFNAGLKSLAKVAVATKATKTKVAKNTAPFSLREKLFTVEKGERPHLTNHFEICPTTEDIWEYEILGLDAGGCPKRKCQVLFKKAMIDWPLLRDNAASIATDGLKTIISWKKLHEVIPTDMTVHTDSQNEDQTGAIWNAPGIVDGNQTIPTRFSFVRRVAINDMKRKSLSDKDVIFEDKEVTTATEKCLNILISKSLNSDVIQVSGKKFYVRAGRHQLAHKTRGPSISLEIMRGYYYCVKPGMGNLLLNFNVATSAFFCPILVSEFISDDKTFLDEFSRRKVLKKVSVYIEYPREKSSLNEQGARVKTIVGFSDVHIDKLSFKKKKKSADGKYEKDANGEFVLEAKETFVHKYLETVFNKPVKEGRYAVNVGTKAKPVWYSQDHLRIIPYQIYTRPVPDHLTSSMVEQAAHKPEISQHLIEKEGLEKLGFTAISDTKTAFRNNVPLELYPTMLRVHAEKLDPPGVVYKDSSKAIRSPGWSLPANAKYYQSGSAFNYFLIDNCKDINKSVAYADAFDEQVMNRLSINPGRLVPKGDYDGMNDTPKLEAQIAEAAKRHAGLVLLVIPAFDRDIYKRFKNLTDRVHGLQSICVTLKDGNFDSAGNATNNLTKYMSNVALKVNFKRGGVNSVVQDLGLPAQTMLLGADVVHPGTAAYDYCPSVASIVGSTNGSATKYLGSMRLQDNKQNDREIITAAKEMIMERIRDWISSNGNQPPKVIIYFRDGVSEGQYGKVVTKEVDLIKRAWADQLQKSRIMKTNAMSIKVLAIVGVKRHHARFYPIVAKDKDADRGNSNCLPGTLIDRGVTSPYYRDFYLQSHQGIKGTTRSTHYFVVKDESVGITPENLPKVIHKLCYTYCRSTTGVSYATPTYYADRLCERGRLYIPDALNSGNGEFLDELDTKKRRKLVEQKKARNLQFRGSLDTDHNKAVHNPKSAQELVQEGEDRRAFDEYVKELVMEKVKEEFYFHKPADAKSGNPWHAETGKYMFWM